MWTACKGKILTMDNLQKHGFILTNACLLCIKNGESINHIIIHCEYAREMWYFTFREVGLVWRFTENLTELIDS